MKQNHHAYATQQAVAMRRPPKLTLKQRQRCIHPPPDGREVAVKPPEPPLDFADIIAGAKVHASWTPAQGVNISRAFAAVGL
jgi:hypothetical protein